MMTTQDSIYMKSMKKILQGFLNNSQIITVSRTEQLLPPKKKPNMTTTIKTENPSSHLSPTRRTVLFFYANYKITKKIKRTKVIILISLYRRGR